MYRLSFIVLLLLTLDVQGQNPHGDNLVVDCKACHTSNGWDYVDTLSFDHANTDFALEGQHEFVDCKACHSELIFESANGDCMSCHEDLHAGTVGNDCIRCHTTNNWLVDHIPELHEQNGFVLSGAHATVNCISCHTSDNQLIWTRIGNDCINCHLDDYEATSTPPHAQTGFSTDCAQCHSPLSAEWGSDNFHLFFPLTGGHDLNDCYACHQTSTFEGLSSDCISCHNDDFRATTEPNHVASNFSNECTECHTTDAWSPAEFRDHDGLYFPIYSGEHQGEWNRCTDCHTQAGSYSTFSCINCHEHNKRDMDDEHDDENGYRYESNACYNCHPKGKADD